MKCPLCEQEKGDLGEDELCLDCTARYAEDFPHEQEDIICSDSYAEYQESPEDPSQTPPE